MKPKLLILGDSPTVNTGFANVVRNLAQRWLPSFERIDIWGINYNGWPHEYPYRIFPAGYGDWTGDGKMMQFLNLIGASDYTHLFILCDCHNLSRGNIPTLLRQICDKKGVSITHYYPVDANLEKKWLELAAVCDHAVTYTEYGRLQTIKAKPGFNPLVIPHGVDTSVFFPREDRESLRDRCFGGWVKPEDFVMVNVNRNERRKAPHHSLEILKRLLEMNVRAKLFMHMPKDAHGEYTDLEEVGAQLDLPVGKAWKHNDAMFLNGNGRTADVGMNELYNCADMVLTTSISEGWGLSLSEGAAAGCHVAAGAHTSCKEIGEKFASLGAGDQFHLLPLAPQCMVNPMDSSRVRYPIDVIGSANIISTVYSEHADRNMRFVLNDELKEWMSWDRIAAKFLEVML